MAAAHVPAGYLADRFGRKPVMFAAWLMGTIAAWIMALAETLPLFVIGLLAYGVTLFVVAPLNSYVTAASGRMSVGRAVTLISASFNLGAVLGPWLGGRIGDRMGLQQTYRIAAVLFVLSTLIFLFIRPQPVEARTQSHRPADLLKNRTFLLFLFVVFLAMFAMFLPQPFSPNFLQNQRGLSVERIGWLYAMTGVGIVSLNLVLGQLKPQIGFLLSQAAVGVFALTLWMGTGLPWFAMGYFLLGGYRAARSLALARAQTLIDKVNMGLAYGITETVGTVATILAPPLAGLMYNVEPVRIFSISAGFAILAMLANGVFSFWAARREGLNPSLEPGG
jgi:MFS family permease